MRNDNAARDRTQRPRTQGRPKNDEHAVGRDGLITATRDLLRTTSPAKVTRTEIAEYAGVDPGLIRYYFGNKDNLLLAVALRLTHERGERTRDALARARTTRAKLKAWIDVLIAVMGENPYYSLLLLDQVHRGTSREAQKARRSIVANTFSELRGIVEEGERNGEFRKVDPYFLHLATIGMCQFFYSRRPLLEELLGGPIPAGNMADMADAYIDFVADMLIHGLEKHPAEPTRDRAPRAAARAGTRTKVPAKRISSKRKR